MKGVQDSTRAVMRRMKAAAADASAAKKKMAPETVAETVESRAIPIISAQAIASTPGLTKNSIKETALAAQTAPMTGLKTDPETDLKTMTDLKTGPETDLKTVTDLRTDPETGTRTDLKAGRTIDLTTDLTTGLEIDLIIGLTIGLTIGPIIDQAIDPIVDPTAVQKTTAVLKPQHL